MAKTEKNVDELSFEQAIAQLTAIVSKIEAGQVPLQTSIQQYEKGMALIKHCRAILQKAEKRIQEISEPTEDSQHDPKQNSDDLF